MAIFPGLLRFNKHVGLRYTCDNLIYVYIWNDYHSKVSEHIHHLIAIFVYICVCVFMMRTFKISSVSKFKVYNTVGLTTVTIFYIRTPEVI